MVLEARARAKITISLIFLFPGLVAAASTVPTGQGRAGALLVLLTGVLLSAWIVSRWPVSLDDAKISFGRFPRRVIGYQNITKVHHTFAQFRGASALRLTIVGRNKRERVDIPLAAFDRDKIALLVAVLRAKSPQARFDHFVLGYEKKT